MYPRHVQCSECFDNTPQGFSLHQPNVSAGQRSGALDSATTAWECHPVDPKSTMFFRVYFVQMCWPMTIARFVRHREIPGMAFTNKGVLVELYQDFSIFVNAILEAHIAKVKAIKERNANMALAPVRESINHYLEQVSYIILLVFGWMFILAAQNPEYLNGENKKCFATSRV